MASEKVSNRSKNGLLGASDDAFEVGACQEKFGAIIFAPSPQTMALTKKNFFFRSETLHQHRSQILTPQSVHFKVVDARVPFL